AEEGGVMDALLDWLDLRFAVSDIVGSREISDVLKRLTLTAEAKLNTRLRTQWQIKGFAPAWVGNEASLPSDYLELACSDNRLVMRANAEVEERIAAHGDFQIDLPAPPAPSELKGGNVWGVAKW